jgi:hypothetical protein
MPAGRLCGDQSTDFNAQSMGFGGLFRIGGLIVGSDHDGQFDCPDAIFSFPTTSVWVGGGDRRRFFD